MSSAGSASSPDSVSDRCGLLSEEHLLQRVGAEPETERLERDDLLGRDVPEVHLGPEMANEPRLRGLRRRLEDDLPHVDLVNDLVDQAGTHLAGRPEDAGGAPLTAFGD